MSDDILKSIDARLLIATKLLALEVVKGKQSQEQIKLLHDVGMEAVEIAECLGKTTNYVRVAIHTLKKKQRGSKNE